MKLLAIERTKTQAVLDKFFQEKKSQYADVDPSFVKLISSIHKQTVTGGKMARATLTRWSFEYVQGDENDGDIITGSAAVELLHRFLLIHDDIIDRDLVRHGIGTVEAEFQAEQQQSSWIYPIKLHGIGMAMIGGDLSHAYAYDLISRSKFDAERNWQVLRGFTDCLSYTAAGWRLETILKQMPIEDVSQSAIERAMMLVSGQYSVVWPLRFGMLYAGFDYGKWDRSLEKFGESLGLAFQLQDDIIGITGDPEIAGKPVGSDLREAKKTLLIYEGYQRATPAEKTIIRRALGKAFNQDSLEQIIEILNRHEVIDDLKHRAQILAKQATKSLNPNSGNVQAYNHLVKLAHFLVERDY